MGRQHALAIPFSAQDHVIPLMELSNHLAERGFKITFLNTEFNHEHVMAALSENYYNQNQIHLISIPDGMEPGDDRTQLGDLCTSMLRNMPGYLEELIKRINESGHDKLTCINIDESMGWAVKTAKKMGIPQAVFWPNGAGPQALFVHIPRLIEAGTIDADGTPTKQQIIQLSPTMPAVSTEHFGWNRIGDLKEQHTIFHYIYSNTQAVRDANWLLCNSFYELEPTSFKLNPTLSPVGPLLAGSQPKLAGNFWQEDPTCLGWLDQQSTRSVIYVAFGSFTIFDQHQFHELALGLELSGHPFLWVVRPDFINGQATAIYPDGFQVRVATQGHMVGWATQQKVLAHPSIACFLTHCGWNSTMEGSSQGIPFLCWPYFADQFLNQSYISDVWNVGLQLNPNNEGIISRQEIKNKVEELLRDTKIQARALELKEIAEKTMTEGGSSMKNLNDFVEAMKEK